MLLGNARQQIAPLISTIWIYCPLLQPIAARRSQRLMRASQVSHLPNLHLTIFSPTKVDLPCRCQQVANEIQGNVVVVGRKSPYSLYDEKIASFEDDGGLYNQKDAAGFIKLQALRLRTLGVNRSSVSSRWGSLAQQPSRLAILSITCQFTWISFWVWSLHNQGQRVLCVESSESHLSILYFPALRKRLNVAFDPYL